MHINLINTYTCVIYVITYMYLWNFHLINWFNGWIINPLVTWGFIGSGLLFNKKGGFCVWYIGTIIIIFSFSAEVFFALMFSSLVLTIFILLLCCFFLILFLFYIEIKWSSSNFMLSISLPSYKKAKYCLSILYLIIESTYSSLILFKFIHHL